MNEQQRSQDAPLVDEKGKRPLAALTDADLLDPKVFRQKALDAIQHWFADQAAMADRLHRKVRTVMALCVWGVVLQVLIAGFLGFIVARIMLGAGVQ